MEQVEVKFRADTHGTFPMTWGQQHIWRLLRRSGDASWNFNISNVLDVPAAGLDEVVAALQRLVERNQSLRTHFADGQDGPEQRIAAAGTFTVGLVRAAPGAGRERAYEVAANLAQAPFSHEKTWGVRIVVVCAGAQPTHVVFVISHVVADGAGVQALIDDFIDLLRPGTEPEPRWQPADQVTHELSGRAARRNRAALGYWRKQLGLITPAMFPDPPRAPGTPRFQRLRLQSHALAVAAATLADGCEVSAPSVVLAGTALALTALAGQASCALMLVAGNRFDRQTRSMIAPLSEDCLFAAEYAGGSVGDAIRATQRAARATYFYGQFCPDDVTGLTAKVAAERGVSFDLTIIYNDQSQFADAAAELPDQTVLVPDVTWEGQDCTLYLAAVTGPEGCILDLVADTARIPPLTMDRLLRGVETIITEAARRDLAVAEIPALTGLRPDSTPVLRGEIR